MSRTEAKEEMSYHPVSSSCSLVHTKRLYKEQLAAERHIAEVGSKGYVVKPEEVCGLREPPSVPYGLIQNPILK